MAVERHVFLGMTAIIGSTAMTRVLELAQRVARANVAVLITGETGSGKEIVSRAIHHYSLRCSKPFVDINCGALPDQLMESELFGHEKGAFSGADSAKPGMFELAHTGTLFLDEVAELDPRMQVKLLRVLDAVPYYRLGGQKKVQVDVRVIAATNQDLERGVAAGRFRSDLYHRLAEYEIRVPPLRERIDDIVPLAEYFLAQHSERAVFAKAAVSALCRYSWPGNIRELRNAVVNAIVSARKYVVEAEDLPARVRGPLPMTPERGLLLEGLERDAILTALARTEGHHQKAADLLGISRRTLSRKLRVYRRELRQEVPAWQLTPVQ
ncbi:MAG TPA: sigma-54 dependent transcriptional regulator [Bryobacteraceae bacterium]|nr:sigma-54 dependent transcriptional regulator [Bryobacteraceae bacterium]